MYGRTHFLFRPEEEENEFTNNAAAAFGDAAEDVRNELGMLKSADTASGCGIPIPLIILGVIGSAALVRICINETVNYIEARSKPNYPGGKTLHFFTNDFINTFF